MTVLAQPLAIFSDSLSHLRPSSRQVVGVAVNSFFASPKKNSSRSVASTTPPPLPSVSLSYFRSSSANSSTNHDVSVDEDVEGEVASVEAVAVDVEDEYCTPSIDDIEIEIENTGNNSRRIRSRIPIEANLQTVWNILTDYARLAEFIPNLTISQLLEKGDNFARLLQVGQQELAFGLNFKAKGIVDCYEKDLICFSSSQRRDIEFKMIEGDFQLFEGKWSIEQRLCGAVHGKM
ncbi:uncharacterized protein LOC124917480 isoform X2 [Impatiens glandulifera]|uniref:uncharacterized protein LOC124917480 isoform X2 n=1 Tax=Impatiens glandulifera TaxID=253017 RepID=UPI001FB0F2DD|nr:uncharacterized protein LOC124917480 isoform X2 [Impatiens glandulifera]